MHQIWSDRRSVSNWLPLSPPSDQRYFSAMDPGIVISKPLKISVCMVTSSDSDAATAETGRQSISISTARIHGYFFLHRIPSLSDLLRDTWIVRSWLLTGLILNLHRSPRKRLTYLHRSHKCHLGREASPCVGERKMCCIYRIGIIKPASVLALKFIVPSAFNRIRQWGTYSASGWDISSVHSSSIDVTSKSEFPACVDEFAGTTTKLR